MIRLIHSSDWHLGSTLHGVERDGEHKAFLKWLSLKMEETQADVLLVSGDIFDTANPSSMAFRILYDFLKDIHQRLPNLQIILLGGNHDSPNRLEAPKELFGLANTRVVGSCQWNLDGSLDAASMCFPLKNKEGEIGAYIGALPFLRAVDLYRGLELEDANSITSSKDLIYERPLQDSFQNIYNSLRRALSECIKNQPQVPIILTGHLYASGSTLTPDSERAIQRGNIESVSPLVFGISGEDGNNALPSPNYVALGHLHLAQRVGGEESIRYSGSPIALSFSENNYPHQVLLVEFNEKNEALITPQLIPVFRPLLRIPKLKAGNKEDTLAELRNLPSKGEVNPHLETLEQSPLLEIRFLLKHPDSSLRKEVEEILQNKDVVLCRMSVELEKGETELGVEDGNLMTLDQLEPEQIFAKMWKEQRQGEPDDISLKAFRDLLEQVQGQ